jgi:Xaa-Pro aminopeptidase
MTAWLGTPDVGTGMLEHRERVRFAELRAARRARVLAAMEEHGLDACLLGREANARYVAGVRRLWTAQSRPWSPTCVLVRATGALHLLSFSASYEGVPEELAPDDVYPVTWSPARAIGHVTATPGLRDARRIGVDGMTPMFQRLLEAALPSVEWAAAEPILRALRRRKLPEELACIRTAVAIAESALYEAARRVAPGVREKELQAVYLARMCELGTSQFAQQGTFTAIAPHGGLRWMTGERVLAAGSLVALAGGALWAGYEGSLARTWWCGAPSALGREHRALHALASEAVARLAGRARPGASGADLRAALAATAAGRAGATFSVTCIGLGSEGALAGSAQSRAVEAQERVAAGMVLAVRVFVPGSAGGSLLEEMFAVGERGSESLTTLGHGPLAAPEAESAAGRREAERP